MLGVVAVAAALTMVVPGVAGAGSSGESSEPLVLGVITPETGNFSAVFGPTVAEAAQCRLDTAGGEINGQEIQLVAADTQSTPANSLTQVRDLVENKGAFAIMSVDPFIGQAAAYLNENNIPVLGQSWQGFFFTENPNMFSIPESPAPGRPGSTQWGDYYKFRKGTKLAVFSVGLPPSSAQNAEAIAASAEDAGLEVVFENYSIPPGGYDFTGDAQSAADAGADSIISTLDAASNIRLFAALKQAGVELKAPLTLQGFDQTTLDDPAIADALAGADMFAQAGIPSVNKGSKKMVKALNKCGLEGDVPTFGAWNGWSTTDLALFGLTELGKPATPEDRQAYIDGLRQISDYTVGGITGPYDMTVEAIGTGEPAGKCLAIAKLNADGTKFVPIRKKPFCGEIIPGTEVIT